MATGSGRGIRHALAVCGVGLGLAVAALPVAAKPVPETVPGVFEDALIRFEKRDFRGAIIQLKNVLQGDAQNLAARVLIGKALVRLGRGVEAERQIRIARRAGADADQTLVPLGQAYLLQKKYDLVLREIQPGRRAAEVESDILVLRGKAHLEQRRPREADTAFAAAARLQPDNANPLIGRATVAIQQGRLEAGRAYVERAVALEPLNPEAWYLKAELGRSARDFEGAIADYGKAIEISERHIPARMARAALLSELGRLEAAERDITFVRRFFPSNAQAALLHAMILARMGDAGKAQNLLNEAESVIRATDQAALRNNAPSLLVAGAVNFALKQYDEARGYLLRYVEIDPNHAGARRMLGTILLRRGSIVKAIEILEPAVALEPDSAGVLSVLGEAYMRAKRFKEATELFNRAVALAPERTGYRMRLALGRLAAGRTSEAIDDLESALKLDRTVRRAGWILGLIHLRSGRTDAALETARLLRAKEPDNPFPENLSGLAFMRKGDLEAARARFERALRLDPEYDPARYNLASLDQREGRVDAARTRYREILERKPAESAAMFELAKLAERQGRIKEAFDWLRNVERVNVNTLEASLRMAELYLRTRDARAALKIALRLEQDYPVHLRVLEIKARAELGTGNRDGARVTLQSLSGLAQQMPARLLGIARLQMRLADYDGALWSLQAVLRRDPERLGAQIALARLYLATGRIEDAMALARRLRTARPQLPIGDLLDGDALMRARRFGEAVAAYEAGLAKKPDDTTLALRRYRAEGAAGRGDAARTRLADWIAANPESRPARRVLALAEIGAGRLDVAQRMYLALAGEDPEDAVVANNLALLLLRRGDARALDYAERAWRLKPESPALLDTLGWVLVSRGEAERGLTLLREANARDAGQLDIRYHIAVALERLGRRDEARREIESVLAIGRKFESAEAARALLARLKAAPAANEARQ
jgi:putative PEP-CTERM system TPR-repeat lipoprotein